MTPTELKFAALKETGIVGVLETPGPEQGALATERYTGLHAMLLKDRMVNWAVGEDIPAGAQQAMIWLLAFLCAKVLGAPDEEMARLAALGSYGAETPSVGERMLLSYISRSYVSQPAQAEYF